MRFSKPSIKILLYVLATIGLGIYLWTSVSFGFVPLFILLIAFLCVPLLFPRVPEEGPGLHDFTSLTYTVLCLAFGLLCLFALRNYVNPDKEVFKNTDHHALRVDGIAINDDRNFILAGNSRDAFFDNRSYRGRIRVDGVENGRVNLRFDRFSMPVYAISHGMKVYELLNPEAFPSFHDGDSVEFVKRGRNGRDSVIRMVVTPGHENYSKFKFWEHDRDTAVYTFNGQAVSLESRFMKTGLPLSTLLAGTVPEFDPNGIQVFRGRFNYDTKNRDVDVVYQGQPYYIGFNADADLSEIRINHAPVPMPDQYSASIPIGAPFCIGIGTDKTETMCFGQNEGVLTLEFFQPKYQYLSCNTETEDQTLMVTTSMFDESGNQLLGAYSENIALYDFFSKPNNRNQMRPWYLSYHAGKSSTPLTLNVYSDQNYLNQVSMDRFVNANARNSDLRHGLDSCLHGHGLDSCVRYQAYLPGILATNPSIHWLVGVEDFKSTTPFSARKMVGLIIMAILLSALLLGLNMIIGHVIVTDAEYCAYLIVIAFLTIKCFLLWRVTVFPPITSISYFEFNHLRDPELVKYLKLFLLAFYAVVFLYKLYLIVSPKRLFASGDLEIRQPFLNRIVSGIQRFFRNKWVLAGIMFLAYAAIFPMGGGEGTLARIINIMLPVLFFFFFEYRIFRLYGKNYLDNILVENPLRSRLLPVVLSFINIGLAAAITFIKDGGYGVMFLLFGLIVTVFLISDLHAYSRGDDEQKPIAVWSSVLLFAFVVAFGLLYMSMFIWVLDHRTAFSIGLAITLILVFAALSFTLDFYKDLKLKGWITAIILIIGISVGINYGSGKFIDGTHLEYRTRVHMNSPSEILATKVNDQVSQNKFMQASLNDWILKEYTDIGKEVRPLSEKHGYFKLQPQSKLGAMWFAQTTDIVLSRFIIAEHSYWLAALLVIALFFFLLVSARRICNRPGGRFIQIAIPLLLFLQAGLILFANTRRFVFFGQDFPLISITSKMSVLYFFVLMGIFLISTFREKDILEGENQTSGITELDQAEIARSDTKTTVKVLACAFAIILLPVATSWLVKKKTPTDNSSYVSDGMYSLEPLMASVDSVTTALDTVFVEYQKTHPLKLKNDMSAEMAQFKNDSLYQRFMQQELLDTNKFAVRMIERFIDVGSHKNSAKGLIHIKTKRQYDTDGNAKEYLSFGIYDGFYEYQLPRKQKDAWKGSIVADGSMPYDTAQRVRSEGLVALRLKKEWLKEDADLLLVRAEGAPVRVLGEHSVVDISAQGLPVASVSGKDNLMRGGRVLRLNLLPRENYYARNVMVNGTRTFLYPHGPEMFWMREFSGQIKLAKESAMRPGNKLASKEEKNRFDENVPITISDNLTMRIYQLYMNAGSTRDKTVVVADGDGHVKAMVDYRGDRRFRLNPNDEKGIHRIDDSLYMHGLRRSPAEQRYFSTFATSPLRLGPGSSQKPIVWTAVTSGYNTGFWSSLTILPLPTTPIIKPQGARDFDYSTGFHLLDGGRTGHFYFPYFAGQKIQKNFKSIGGDEGYAGNPIPLDWYMYKSSNYYNAMMAYFGLFTKEQLQEMLPTTIPLAADPSLLVQRVPDRALSLEQNRSFFPIMNASSRQINLSGYNRFAFAHPVSQSDYQNPKSLLANGLETQFDLPLKRETRSLYPSIKKYVKDKDGKFVVRPGFGNVSYFNMRIRNKYIRPEEMMEVGLRTVAIGNNTSWIVSPLKMAEMYGRLLTLDTNYTLTLDPNSSHQYQSFRLDGSWRSSNQYQAERESFIRGMSRVFATDGTAYGFTSSLTSLGIVRDTENGGDGYFIYGKTGTINGKWDRKERTDHMLAVIITNRQISTCEDLGNVKFYVLYFADYDYGSNWVGIDLSIFQEVVRSEEFQRYMNSDN